jgi:AraC-like DNA-binding protein
MVPHLHPGDPLLHHMTLVLQAAIDAEEVPGRLYAESLTNALAVHLLRRYGTCGPPVRACPASLSTPKLRRTTAYIEAHLAQELPVTELAAVAQTSPAYFARLFRQATGQTPHQYVVMCRIEHAKSLAGLTDEQLRALLLDDTVLPSTLRRTDGTRATYTLSTGEVLEACRALKGAILRQEVYALDGTDEADRPYSTSERNYTIELLQPRDGNKHAVLFTHAREQVDFHYERALVEVNGQKRADPRMSHAMTLEVDAFGNVLRAVAIGYRRRDLPGVDAPEQQQTHLTLTVNRFANHPDERDWYRIGLPVETRTYEIVTPPASTITDTRIGLFPSELIAALTAELFPLDQPEPDAATLWPYEKWDWRINTANAPTDTRLRLIEHVRTVYRRDDLTGPLALGQVESLALPFESYKLAFTPELAQQTFVESGKLTAAELNDVLGNEGKYVHSEGDANWWIPSGQMFYSPGTNDPAAEEIAHARPHFFLPHRYRDPFHTDQLNTETMVTFDDYKLLVVETRDALGNTVRAENDYRVLGPHVMTDPNGNRSEVTFDTLGMVVATAVKGKAGQNLGDLLEDFDRDPPLPDLQAFVADPRGQAASLLGKATTRIVYDLDRYQRSAQPPFAATLARETHFFDPDGPQTNIQVSFSYSDGFGREVQKKIQAEAGDAPQRSPNVTLPSGDVRPGDLVRDTNGPPIQAQTPQRWVGNRRTVFNNKGKPVKQYEPFFSATHLYEEEREMTDTGFSPILFYDPVERVVVTLHPNHTWEKVLFDPWRQET